MTGRPARSLAFAGLILLLAACQLTPGAPPPAAALANLEYTGIFPAPVRLHDGRYEGEPYVAGGASRPRVDLVTTLQASCDLDDDGRQETAVFLVESSGGSGTRTWLAVVADRNGRPVNVATRLLGDRVQVRSLVCRSGRLIVNTIAAGPDDPACCPTRKLRQTFSLAGHRLAEVESIDEGPISVRDLEDRTWRLIRLPGDEPVPEGITIDALFREGRVSGNGGCNRYFASVRSGGAQGLTVGDIGTTRMACAPPRMKIERQYLQALQKVSAFRFVFGDLLLMGQDTTRQYRMRFSGQQVASPSG